MIVDHRVGHAEPQELKTSSHMTTGSHGTRIDMCGSSKHQNIIDGITIDRSPDFLSGYKVFLTQG